MPGGSLWRRRPVEPDPRGTQQPVGSTSPRTTWTVEPCCEAEHDWWVVSMHYLASTWTHYEDAKAEADRLNREGATAMRASQP